MMVPTSDHKLIVNMHIRRPKRLLTILPMMMPGIVSTSLLASPFWKLTEAEANIWQPSEQGQPPRRYFKSTLVLVEGPEFPSELIHGLRGIEALLLKPEVELGYGDEHDTPRQSQIERVSKPQVLQTHRL
jgi:hypothetical protein